MHKIGIIGLGVMGRRMAEAMTARTDMSVLLGFDPKASATSTAVPLAASGQEVLESDDVECVYIASPPASHLALVRAAVETGKAILCEKPLAHRLEDIEGCVKAVADGDVPAAVNFPFATAPAAARLMELASNSALGLNVRARLVLRFARWPRPWQAEAGNWLAQPEQGGFMREVGSHFLFLMHRMFGAGKLHEAHVERGIAGTETVVRARVAYGDVPLEIDAAVAGDVDDYNLLELRGDKDRAGLTDWYRLEHGGVVSDREAPTSTQLDHLVRLLSGQPHRLARFDEAAAVACLVEEILATA